MNDAGQIAAPGAVAPSGTPLSVCVWAVYPPNAGWRGEGITQSIENMILHAPDDVHFSLIVSPHHLPVVEETLGGKANVRLIPYGVQFRKMRAWDDKVSLIRYVGETESVGARLSRWMQLITKKVERWSWQIVAPFSSKSVRHALTRSDLIFNPSPVYAFTGKKKTKKVFGFWDPFVFEYAEFGDARTKALRSFLYKFVIKADGIITQSESNARYLSEVWSIDRSKVSVIHNGSPDYSEVFRIFSDSLGDGSVFGRENILQLWPSRRMAGYTRIEAARVYFSDTLNKSILFRLAESIRPETKILIASTQHRPYKGFHAIFNLMDTLIAEGVHDYRFIFTAEIPDKLRGQFAGRYPWLADRVFEMTRLSNLQHACLYRICDLALHPSFAEGGPTLYPASEAASVGIPALTNAGRHTRELLRNSPPETDEIIINFLDRRRAADHIVRLLSDPEAAARNVELINKVRVSWRDTSEKYIAMFREVARQGS